MAGPYSVYSIDQTTSKWKPGEQLAADAFISMALLLVLEVNLEIFRIFRRRKGLYFWAMTLGSWGVAVDAIGMCLKYLAGDILRTWVLNTLLMCVGWATYTVAQLTVLYSRLHLVSESSMLHRAVLVMFSVLSPMIIITDWVTAWGAYNPDTRRSRAWWPRHAIVERVAPTAFTAMEVIISAIYIQALLKLLQMRSSVRQRRVMLDLIYVLILVVSLDVINIVLVFLNQTGLCHPIQTFSYILKLRLEFLVLNQLMAVAACGIQRETFGEKRYHNPQALREFSTFGPGLQNIEITDPGSVDDEQRTQRGSILTALPSISPQSTTRQSSFPAAAVENPPTDADGWEKITHGEPRKSWLPMTYDDMKHKRSGEERILPQAGKSKNRTFWRYSGDEPDEEEEVGPDQWEFRGSATLQVPWFRSTIVP